MTHQKATNVASCPTIKHLSSKGCIKINGYSYYMVITPVKATYTNQLQLMALVLMILQYVKSEGQTAMVALSWARSTSQRSLKGVLMNHDEFD